MRRERGQRVDDDGPGGQRDIEGVRVDSHASTPIPSISSDTFDYFEPIENRSDDFAHRSVVELL